LTFLVFLLFCVIDGVTFTPYFLCLIIPILCLIVFNIGTGLILSALFVFFRDIRYLWSVFTMLLMYMSAIFYTTDVYSPLVQGLFYINPIYVYIKYMRILVLDGHMPSLELTVLSVFYALAVLGIGALIYKTKNHKFLYYI
jgi:ABC-2 type transport system permease protein